MIMNVLQILLQQSVGTVKRLSMELGGNGPCMIFNSADLQRAVQGAFIDKFRNGGQVSRNIPKPKNQTEFSGEILIFCQVLLSFSLKFYYN